jgi:glycosyltransferase involved in cell wall biosynthesis
MRVLVVASAETTSLRWGDAARPVHLPAGLAGALAGAGHDARLELLPDPEADGTPQPHAYARAAAAGAWLADRVDGAQGAVLHALDPAAAMACLAARSETGVPVVVRWGALPEPTGAIERRLRLATLRAADVVLASTEALARQARAGGAPRVAVVSDGVDCAALGPAADLRPDSAERRLVTLSGPDAAGGTADLVAALRHVPDAELVVAGRASDDAAADRLLQAAHGAGLGDRVRWLGWLPRERALDLLTDADVVVAPRRSPTAAASALEAMCRARPVVGTQQPVLEDVVEHGTTGLLVPPGDGAALAAALRSLLGDPFRREALAQAGADRVGAVYDWSRVVVHLEAAYEQAPAATPPGQAGVPPPGGRTPPADAAIA